MLATPGRGEGEESCNAEESTRTSSEKHGSGFSRLALQHQAELCSAAIESSSGIT